jgi:hypothetical protein
MEPQVVPACWQEVGKLLDQQQDADADQGGGDPAAAVDVFMQEELGQDG